MNQDYHSRFLKKSPPRKRDLEIHEDDLFESSKTAADEASASSESTENPIASPMPDETDEFVSLYQIFRAMGHPNWLEQNHKEARMYFNVINLSQHPRRKLAEGLAICPLKGTTFDDKREACVEEATALAEGESTGEVTLRHDKENPYDPFALAVISKYSGKHLGFIPKAAGANAVYIAAMEAGRLMGAYIIEARHSRYKNQNSALLMLATGWKNA